MNYKKKIIFYKSNIHEEKSYKISSKKSKRYLGWKPIYSAQKSILLTSEWYKKNLYNKFFDNKITKYQIIQYLKLLKL